MKNVIILGSGRSGTSMVAGCLSTAGYYMGEHLLASSPSNPKGFFEDAEINKINEDILDSVVPYRPELIRKIFFREIPARFQRWLARVQLDVTLHATSGIEERIKKQVRNTPFCFKDPRFSYTLPIWRPFLENTVFICVFRNPSVTAKSIIKECREDERLHSLTMNRVLALEMWELMYRHIMEIHARTGLWLFLHYDQVLSEDALAKIENITNGPVNRAFPDKSLKRTVANEPNPPAAQEIYDKLCGLAGYKQP